VSEIDTAQIAKILGVSRRHVTDRLVKAPDFPKPTIYVSRKTRLWAEEDVRAWASPDSRRSLPA
jgi:predicted DNA-binding transcriptional regulator AlpA